METHAAVPAGHIKSFIVDLFPIKPALVVLLAERHELAQPLAQPPRCLARRASQMSCWSR